MTAHTAGRLSQGESGTLLSRMLSRSSRGYTQMHNSPSKLGSQARRMSLAQSRMNRSRRATMGDEDFLEDDHNRRMKGLEDKLIMLGDFMDGIKQTQRDHDILLKEVCAGMSLLRRELLAHDPPDRIDSQNSLVVWNLWNQKRDSVEVSGGERVRDHDAGQQTVRQSPGNTSCAIIQQVPPTLPHAPLEASLVQASTSVNGPASPPGGVRSVRNGVGEGDTDQSGDLGRVAEACMDEMKPSRTAVRPPPLQSLGPRANQDDSHLRAEGHGGGAIQRSNLETPLVPIRGEGERQAVLVPPSHFTPPPPIHPPPPALQSREMPRRDLPTVRSARRGRPLPG